MSWNASPDEEGTETDSCLAHRSDPESVGTRAPMKRGLKQNCHRARREKWRCWNASPDEEGTETYELIISAAIFHAGWNASPDEEGTETIRLGAARRRS